MTETEIETFQVRDGVRRITFDGVCLARSSTERAGVWRWSEQAIYRTDTGRWVVEKIGRSRVLHDPDCQEVAPGLPRFTFEHPGVEPTEPEWSYHDCIGDVFDLDTVLVERTRYWALHTTNAPDVIEALQIKKGAGRSMPRMSAELLAVAADLDPLISDAFYSERV